MPNILVQTYKIIKQQFIKSPYVFALLLISLVLFASNYVPGTYLSGWDNIHSEFAPFMNIVMRSLFGVWQENYGLGAFLGNAVVTETLRQPFVFILSLFFNTSMLRYIWHFLMVFIGSLGMYYYMLLLLSNSENSSLSRLTKWLHPFSFVTAVFYMLNIGTVQNFYVPLEAFSHFFAFLPWLLFVLHNFLLMPSRQTFKLFLLVNFFAIPAFYIPTIFIVYIHVFLIYSFLLRSTAIKTSILPILKAFFSILILNAFWLIPFMMFVLTGGSSTVANSQIYQTFSEDAVLRGESYGNYKNILQLKGLWFSTVDVSNGTFIKMLYPWINHLAKPAVNSLVSFIVILVVIGMLYMLRVGGRYKYPLFALWILYMLVLLAPDAYLGVFVSLLRKYIPFFNDVFRLAFTKFIVLGSFLYSIFFAFGVIFFLSILNQLLRLREDFVYKFGIAAFFVAILLYSAPSFSGNYIYRNLKVSLSQDYFDVFEFFKTQPKDARIANFPQPTLLGWMYTDWGYRGSGFYWYGIEQPMLDRTFDVWNKSNENYYKDITYALYSNNSNLFKQILSKYNVYFIWVDKSKIYPENPNLLYTDNLVSMLQGDSAYTLIFSSGNQLIYRYNLSEAARLFTQQAPTTIDFTNKFYYTAITEDSNAGMYPLGGYSSSRFDDSLVLERTFTTDTTLLVPENFVATEDVSTYFSIVPASKGYNILFKPDIPSVSHNNNPVGLSYAPIQLPINLDLSKTLYIVKINNSFYTVDVSDLSRSYHVYLKPSENVVSIYDVDDVSIKTGVTSSFMRSVFENCDSLIKEDSINYGISYNDGIFKLSGHNSSPCLRISFSELGVSAMENVGAIGFNFQYLLDGDTTAKFCVRKIGESSCRSVYSVRASVADTSYRNGDFWISDDVSYTDLELVVFYITPNKGDYTLGLKDFSISSTSNDLLSAQFKSDFPLLTPEDRKISLQVGDEITFRVPYKHASEDLSYIVYPRDIFARALPIEYCNENKVLNLTTDRSLTQLGFDKNALFLSTTGGFICEDYILDNFVGNISYINYIDYKNITGRPLNYCLKNSAAGFCFVNSHLDNSETGYTTLYVPPINLNDGTNLDILLSNYSVTENDSRAGELGTISFYPYPGSWLSAFSELPQANTSIVTDYSGQKGARILPFIYKFDSSYLRDKKILYIDQSYSKFWLNSANLKPLLINTWAQGWQMDTNVATAIYVVFVPQLISLVLLFSSAAFLVIVLARRNNL